MQQTFKVALNVQFQPDVHVMANRASWTELLYKIWKVMGSGEHIQNLIVH
jgi:hypothetical protein